MQKLWVVRVVALEIAVTVVQELAMDIADKNVLAVVPVAVVAIVLRSAVDTAKAHAEWAVQDVLIDDLFHRVA